MNRADQDTSHPLVQQLAEKVHALTRPYAGGEVSRVKDLVDVLLIGQMGDFEIEVLRDSLISTFQARNTHPLPEQLPTHPDPGGAHLEPRGMAMGVHTVGCYVASLGERVTRPRALPSSPHLPEENVDLKA